MKTLNVLLFSLAISWSFGQTKQEKQVVSSKEISTVKRTELKSVNVEKEVVKSKGEPEIIQTISNKPEVQPNYPQKVAIHKENLPKSKAASVQTPMTKEEKISSLQNKINSVEGKIALLSDDAEANHQEILEKKQLLKELNAELAGLQK